MKKIIITILMIILLMIPLGLIQEVKAEDNNRIEQTEETYDDYNYEENEIEEDEEETTEEKEETTEEKEGISSKKSIGVVLIEIFCALIGILMIAIAFKTNESS